MAWVQFISVIVAAFIGAWFGTIWRERAFKRERANQILAAVSSFLAQARRCEDFAQATAPNTCHEEKYGHLHPNEPTYTPDALLTVKLEMWNSGEQARLLLNVDDSQENELDCSLKSLMDDVAEIARLAALDGTTQREDEAEYNVEKGVQSILDAARTVRRKLEHNR